MMETRKPYQEILAKLQAVLGDHGLITDPSQMATYLSDWRNAYQGRSLVVTRPSSTSEVSQVVRICREHGVSMVPQGGNTGLCGGSMPDGSATQVVISLSRMNRIREIDVRNETVTAEAGVILAQLQAAATDAGKYFPLSLGAEGSCTIGGNLASNAGGTAVLRYGNMRDLTLGIEVVLPDGNIWNGLRGLRKDNTGYDLKHLFIGSEGTLGIITAAVLKLYPAIRCRATAWVALPSPDAAVDLLSLMKDHCGDRLTGFELMSRQSVDFVLQHVAGCSDPFRACHPWYVLIQLSDTLPDTRLDEVLEAGLAQGLETDLVTDAAMASSNAQAAALWKIREGISEAQNHEGPSLKHDISIQVSAIPRFIAETDAAILAAVPNARIVCYGHVGDGNLHYNISKPVGSDDATFVASGQALTTAIHESVMRFNGSISAEHGIGQAKIEAMKRFKDPLELGLMRIVKHGLDPLGAMNPGKLFPAS